MSWCQHVIGTFRHEPSSSRWSAGKARNSELRYHPSHWPHAGSSLLRVGADLILVAGHGSRCKTLQPLKYLLQSSSRVLGDTGPSGGSGHLLRYEVFRSWLARCSALKARTALGFSVACGSSSGILQLSTGVSTGEWSFKLLFLSFLFHKDFHTEAVEDNCTECAA